jgi:hypothetical protein
VENAENVACGLLKQADDVEKITQTSVCLILALLCDPLKRDERPLSRIRAGSRELAD